MLQWHERRISYQGPRVRFPKRELERNLVIDIEQEREREREREREKSRCVKIKNIKSKIFYIDVLKTIHIKDK